MPLFKNVVSALTLCFCAAGALPACSADASSESDTREVVVGTSTGPLTVTCIPTLTCCLGAPQTTFTMSDPFQAQLSAWGCTAPRLYAPNWLTNAWWYTSACPDPSGRIETFLKANTKYTSAPYSASITSALSPFCVTRPPTGSVTVLWDPTCASCKLL